MKFALYSSAFIFGLSSLSPSCAMEPDSAPHTNVPMSFPSEGALPDWKTPYYKKKYSFSPYRLDMQALSRAIVTKNIPSTDLLNVLQPEAALGHAGAQERLYTFYTTKAFGLDLVNTVAAEELLKVGLEQEKTWALWAKAKQFPQPAVTKWHCLAANREHPEAKKYLERRYNVQISINLVTQALAIFRSGDADAQGKASAVLNNFTKPWIELNYGQPFLDLYAIAPQELSSAFNRFHYLRNATTWNHNAALEHYLNQYEKQLSPQERFLIAGKMANSDMILGTYNLADLYLNGFEGFKPNRAKALELFLEIIDRGTDSLTILRGSFRIAGVLYNDGFEGQAVDKKKALAIFREGSKVGSTSCSFLAGDLLEHGFEGQLPDKKAALELYQEGAHGGCKDCMYRAALLFHNGFDGFSKNKVRAYELYAQAMKKGHLSAKSNAAILLKSGFHGQRPNVKKALELWKEAAKEGDVIAILNMANTLRIGFRGTKPDKEAALALYLQGATLGDPLCMDYASTIYFKGYGSEPPNLQKALEWAEKSASKESETGMINAGTLLLRSPNRSKESMQKAFTYFERAANRGNVLGWQKMGLILILQGEENRIAEAVRYFKKAVELGDVDSLLYIGILFAEQSSPQYRKISLDSFLEAAHKGNAEAMIWVAKHYLGAFVEDFADPEKALFWLEKAKELKNKKAAILLERMSVQSKKEEFRDQNSEEQNDQEILDLFEKPERTDLFATNNTDHPSRETLLEEDESTPSETADSHESTNSGSEEEDKEVSQQALLLEQTAPDAPYVSDNFQEWLPQPKIRNPKFIREQMRTAYKLKQERKLSVEKTSKRELSPKSKELIEDIFSGRTHNINADALETLFKDEFFQDQVEVRENTKKNNKIKIGAKLKGTKNFRTVSTHRKHNPAQEGYYDPAFFQKLKEVFKLFEISSIIDGL